LKEETMAKNTQPPAIQPDPTQDVREEPTSEPTDTDLRLAEAMERNAELAAENLRLANDLASLRQQLAGVSPRRAADGFVLRSDDPFGLGVMRLFIKSSTHNDQPAMLPFVLPFKDPASRKAIASYIVRAAAANRKDLVKTAQALLDKCVQ
jgi:hypothetical protein